jgi:hypothetical protein
MFLIFKILLVTILMFAVGFAFTSAVSVTLPLLPILFVAVVGLLVWTFWPGQTHTPRLGLDLQAQHVDLGRRGGMTLGHVQYQRGHQHRAAHRHALGVGALPRHVHGENHDAVALGASDDALDATPAGAG